MVLNQKVGSPFINYFSLYKKNRLSLVVYKQIPLPGLWITFPFPIRIDQDQTSRYLVLRQ